MLYASTYVVKKEQVKQFLQKSLQLTLLPFLLLTLLVGPLSGTVFALAPDTTIDSAPNDPSAQSTPTFTFSSPDSPVTFECYMDSDAPTTCVSPYTTPSLTNGSHRFTVQAVNASVETDPTPAYYIWTVAAFEEGDGTLGNPYQISTCSQWLAMNDNLTANYELVGDVDCDGFSYSPIGTNSTPFEGSLNGNGYTIKNVSYSGSSNTGLFGYVANSAPFTPVTIKNLHVVDSSFSGAHNTAALVGFISYADISNVRIRNTTVTSSGDDVGGIVGELSAGGVSTSSFEGTISSTADNVGGIAGQVVGPSSVGNNFSVVTIGGINDVGGIVGFLNTGAGSQVSKSYSIATFTTSSGSRSGTVAEVASGTSNVDTFSVDNLSGTMSDGTPYKNNKTYAPLNTWDFGYGNPWHMTHTYPELYSLDDVDGDGVSNAHEQSSPNSGDANNDGTPDYQQPHVASLSGVSAGKTVVVEAGGCAEVNNLQVGTESSSNADATYDYPSGLVGFYGLECGAAGVSVPVTIDFYGDYDASKFLLRKSTISGYKTISGVTLTNITIGGQKVLRATYTVVDGGPFDDDGLANGNITDPIGLASALPSLATVPNTGLPAQNTPTAAIMLAGLALFGYGIRKLWAEKK